MKLDQHRPLISLRLLFDKSITIVYINYCEVKHITYNS